MAYVHNGQSYKQFLDLANDFLFFARNGATDSDINNEVVLTYFDKLNLL